MDSGRNRTSATDVVSIAPHFVQGAEAGLPALRAAAGVALFLFWERVGGSHVCGFGRFIPTPGERLVTECRGLPPSPGSPLIFGTTG
jgi:hypothetical protein